MLIYVVLLTKNNFKSVLNLSNLTKESIIHSSFTLLNLRFDTQIIIIFYMACLSLSKRQKAKSSFTNLNNGTLLFNDFVNYI